MEIETNKFFVYINLYATPLKTLHNHNFLFHHFLILSSVKQIANVIKRKEQQQFCRKKIHKHVQTNSNGCLNSICRFK